MFLKKQKTVGAVLLSFSLFCSSVPVLAAGVQMSAANPSSDAEEIAAAVEAPEILKGDAQIAMPDAGNGGEVRFLADYEQVLDQYHRYAATEEEEGIVDRMRVLRLLDSAIGTGPRLDSIAISGDVMQVRVSGVTLAQTARIASTLETSPIVEKTVVTTASTTEAADQMTAGVHIYLKKEGAE